jgi:hypothetical protein
MNKTYRFSYVASAFLDIVLLPLLNSEWVVWRVKGGREPGAANP